MSRKVFSKDRPTVLAAEYELLALPEWRRAVEADFADGHDEDAPGPALWSGKADPPAIGARVEVFMNGFGPAVVRGYFVEHRWLGLYVTCDNPPAWWVEQTKREKPARVAPWIGPLVFGLDLDAPARRAS